MAYALAGTFEVTWLLPFAAGNFVCIAAADLVPELTKYPDARRKAAYSLVFAAGLALLLAVALAV